MRIFILAIALLCFLSHQAQAQKKKKKEQKYIYVASSINFYPQIDDYSFSRILEQEKEFLFLEFFTEEGGLFEVIEGTQRVLTEKERGLVSNSVNVGMSFQIRKKSKLYHEFGLTRFSIVKSNYSIFSYELTDDGRELLESYGFDQTSTTIATRYEIGKVFGRKNTALVQFGLSASLEPTYFSSFMTPFSGADSPERVRIFSLDLALIPTVSFRFSRLVYLDLKVIPNFRSVDVGFFALENPNIPQGSQKLKRSAVFGELRLAGAIQLRYTLKEPEEGRKRRKKK